MSREILGFEEGYIQYRGLLLSALGKLGAQGFHVWFDEAADLLHDFFLEEWGKVTAGYNPSRGEFEPYLYAAFVYFARPRIIRLGRIRQRRVDLHGMVEQLGVEPAQPVPAEEPPDTRVLVRALGELPPTERAAIESFLYEGCSERDLADRLEISRYRAHNLLLDAIGRIVLQVAKPPEVQEDEWRIALALWRDGQSPVEAAAALGTSASRVRAARDRLRLVMAAILRAGRPRHTETRSKEELGHD